MALATVAFGQITTTKVAQKTEQIDTSPYDSTRNFLGEDVYKYQGQELYLNELSERLRKYGYDTFVLDYTKDFLTSKSNIYKCCDGNSSKYNELAGKYFNVLEVIKHPKAEQSEYLYGKKFYLKLQEKESNDIVYYEYDSESKYTFPFIVVGFFEKQKQAEVGKEFIVRGKNWISALEPMTDMNTGSPVVNFKAGSKWKAIDLTIEEKYYNLSLILEYH